MTGLILHVNIGNIWCINYTVRSQSWSYYICTKYLSLNPWTIKYLYILCIIILFIYLLLFYCYITFRPLSDIKVYNMRINGENFYYLFSFQSVWQCFPAISDNRFWLVNVVSRIYLLLFYMCFLSSPEIILHSFLSTRHNSADSVPQSSRFIRGLLIASCHP